MGAGATAKNKDSRVQKLRMDIDLIFNDFGEYMRKLSLKMASNQIRKHTTFILMAYPLIKKEQINDG